ncbi:MAG TPA: SpoIIE family protein phosphatase [Terracidiphilus sp.]|jgi:serine phosphatase RsbU (regulator of sigma subunit)|nr:SpoIIE family protein phosphatase [Terracidiphilus sp.]
MSTDIHVPDPNETIDLQQQVARLQALLEASRQVHSTIREDEVLESVLRIVVRELEMAGAAFPGTGLAYGEPIVPAERTYDGIADPPQYPINVLSDPNAFAGLPHFPLLDRDGKRMTELLIGPPEGRELTIYETDFLEGLSLQAAVALENARNHKRNVEFARVQQDLDSARAIQRSLLPQTLPQIEGYSVGFKSTTCYEVGGDYLDIVEMPDGSLLMAVADVAGKGLASAMMSVIFRSAFRAMAVSGTALDELAARMNQHHWLEGEEARRRYVTAIFLRLYADKGEMEIVNCGHNPGFVIHPDGSRCEFESSGTPLGLLPGMRYEIQRCGFPAGSRLLFYTDGLTESFRGDEEFGPERLMEHFSQCESREADGILDALWTAIDEFVEGGPQGDDMTALVLCRGTERAA